MRDVVIRMLRDHLGEHDLPSDELFDKQDAVQDFRAEMNSLRLRYGASAQFDAEFRVRCTIAVLDQLIAEHQAAQ